MRAEATAEVAPALADVAQPGHEAAQCLVGDAVRAHEPARLVESEPGFLLLDLMFFR